MGLIVLLAYGVLTESPIVFLVILLGGFELWRRWTRRNSPASIAYHSLKPKQRLTIGSLYVLIIAATVVGYQLTYVARSVKF